MAQPSPPPSQPSQPPQQPQPSQPSQPSQLLCWKRKSLNKYTIISNAPISDILQAVANAWNKEREKWVIQLSSCMVKQDVAPDDAEQSATTFMDKLEGVNGKDPKVFPLISEVKALVNNLILNLPLEVQKVLLEFEAKYSWYSNYAYGFMQVRIQPIEVKVGDDKPNSVDWTFTNLHMVYSPIPLPDSVVVRPTELKKSFMRLVCDKSTHLWEKMSQSSEETYVKKAINVLLHNMFEKTGINLTGQTVEKIRKKVLINVKWGQELKNFDAIDTVLAQLISFLSRTYIRL
jgi:hypothetical protein